ncbi:MAG: hypothetical protein IJX99_08080 [Clostridia bacterium]|nr:hypothetical protein [Clostridia bacterium]
MNKIWGYIIIVSLVVGLFSGKVELMTTCVFDSAKSTIDTCLNIFGIIAIWSGLMKIAEQTGLIEKLQKVVYPLVRILFPEISKNSRATGDIAMNMGANIIGLGNVATPLGIKAMEELQKENKNKERLSKSMMMFLVLNMASIQLIPTTVIALRTTYGSDNPVQIVVPVLVASFTAALVGVMIVKFFYKEEK